MRIPHRRNCTGGAAIIAALLTGSCHDNPAGPPSGTPAFVVASRSSLLLTPRDTVLLTANVLDKDSALITGATVSFVSSDTSLVQVSAAGEVNSRTKVGVAQVTVSSGTIHAVVPVQVAGTPSAISLAPTDTTIREGASFHYRFRVIDSLGDSIRYLPSSTTFQFSDSVGLTVSSSGIATGLSGGPVTVSVHNGALPATSATVTVTDTNVVAHTALGNAPYGVASGPGGLVYVAPIIGTAIYRIGLPAGSLTDSVAMGNGNPSELAINAAGDTVFVTKRAAGSVAIVPVAAHSQTDSIVVPGEPYSIILGPSGTAFIGTGSTSEVYKVDLASRALTDSVAVSGYAIHMAMGAGDSLLYAAEYTAGGVAEIRISSMAIKRTFTQVGSAVQDVATSPDGAELYVADEGGWLRIVHLSDGTRDSVRVLGGAFGVTTSGDGQTIAVGTTAGFVYFLNRTTHALKHRVWVQGVPRLLRIDASTGLTVVANEGSNEVDVVR